MPDPHRGLASTPPTSTAASRIRSRLRVRARRQVRTNCSCRHGRRPEGWASWPEERSALRLRALWNVRAVNSGQEPRPISDHVAMARYRRTGRISRPAMDAGSPRPRTLLRACWAQPRPLWRCTSAPESAACSRAPLEPTGRVRGGSSTSWRGRSNGTRSACQCSRLAIRSSSLAPTGS
jgi:hypothetical protein